MTHEILRVTPTGDFVWHEDADKLIEESDFTNSPAMQHILRALRKQRTWVGLTDDEKQKWIDAMPYDIEPRHCMSLINVMELQLKQRNT